jgi:hypothetical protein
MLPLKKKPKLGFKNKDQNYKLALNNYFIGIALRTAEAENQNVVFFNRIPKTGSEMFQVKFSAK